MKDSIGINSFVLRQTKESPYGYYDGSFDELFKLVQDSLYAGNYSVVQKKDEIERVILVRVNPDGFYTSMVTVDENTKFKASFEKRRDCEEGYIKTVALGGEKVAALFVNIVLYSHEALLEGRENSTECDWELISINASPIENEPMHPLTMARNYLEKVGGTKAEYSAKEFADAIWYWKDKVSIV